MNENRTPGENVAVVIGVIKWIIIGLALVWGAISVLNIELGTELSRTWEIVAAVATLLFCLWIWVLFGWFEHTLMNLAQIERNTRPRGTEWVTPGGPVDQGMRRTAGL